MIVMSNVTRVSDSCNTSMHHYYRDLWKELYARLVVAEWVAVAAACTIRKTRGHFFLLFLNFFHKISEKREKWRQLICVDLCTHFQLILAPEKSRSTAVHSEHARAVIIIKQCPTRTKCGTDSGSTSNNHTLNGRGVKRVSFHLKPSIRSTGSFETIRDETVVLVTR
jgi:hypothetical protein